MLQVTCAGCLQPLDDAADACAYCRPVTTTADEITEPTRRDVWCISEQRHVSVAWTRVGQAFVCECTRAHEILECAGCGKVWGTAVNSFGETDRSGRRRCGSCRIPRPEEAVAVSTCARCGIRGRQGMLGRLHLRRRRPLECLECRAPVGWWRARRTRYQGRHRSVGRVRAPASSRSDSRHDHPLAVCDPQDRQAAA